MEGIMHYLRYYAVLLAVAVTIWSAAKASQVTAQAEDAFLPALPPIVPAMHYTQPPQDVDADHQQVSDANW